MKCPKCKKGTLEEDYFDENIGVCDTCKTNFTYSNKKTNGEKE